MPATLLSNFPSLELLSLTDSPFNWSSFLTSLITLHGGKRRKEKTHTGKLINPFMVKHTVKILRCKRCKICKVCLAIFHYHA